MNEAVMLDPARLVIAALVGLALLLILIIKFKIHAMLSILIGAITIGIVAGMPLTNSFSCHFRRFISPVDMRISSFKKEDKRPARRAIYFSSKDVTSVGKVSNFDLAHSFI